MLTINVPYGNAALIRVVYEEIRYLSIAPKKPPKPTAITLNNYTNPYYNLTITIVYHKWLINTLLGNENIV